MQQSSIVVFVAAFAEQLVSCKLTLPVTLAQLAPAAWKVLSPPSFLELWKVGTRSRKGDDGGESKRAWTRPNSEFSAHRVCSVSGGKKVATLPIDGNADAFTMLYELIAIVCMPC